MIKAGQEACPFWLGRTLNEEGLSPAPWLARSYLHHLSHPKLLPMFMKAIMLVTLISTLSFCAPELGTPL